MRFNTLMRILYASELIIPICGALIWKAGFKELGISMILWVFVAMFIQFYFVLSHAKECSGAEIT